MAPDLAALADVSAGSALAEMELGQVDAAVKRLDGPGHLQARHRGDRGQPARAPTAPRLRAAGAGDGVGCRARTWRRPSAPASVASSSDLATPVRLHPGARPGGGGPLRGRQRRPQALAHARRPRGPGPTPASSWTPSSSTAAISCPRRARRSPPPPRSPSPGRPSGWPPSPAPCYRREGERAYGSGNMRVAEKAFKAALALDAGRRPGLQHNLACVAYRRQEDRGRRRHLEKLEATVPQATLNLGIDAQERRRDIGRGRGLLPPLPRLRCGLAPPPSGSGRTGCRASTACPSPASPAPTSNPGPPAPPLRTTRHDFPPLAPPGPRAAVRVGARRWRGPQEGHPGRLPAHHPVRRPAALPVRRGARREADRGHRAGPPAPRASPATRTSRRPSPRASSTSPWWTPGPRCSWAPRPPRWRSLPLSG